jgi:hypothetical protein
MRSRPQSPPPRRAPSFSAARRRLCSLLALGAAGLSLRPRVFAADKPPLADKGFYTLRSSALEGRAHHLTYLRGYGHKGAILNIMNAGGHLLVAAPRLTTLPSMVTIDREALAATAPETRHPPLEADQAFLWIHFHDLSTRTEQPPSLPLHLPDKPDLSLSLPPLRDSQGAPVSRLLGLAAIEGTPLVFPLLFAPGQNRLPVWMLETSNLPDLLAARLPGQVRDALVDRKQRVTIHLQLIPGGMPDETALLRHSRALSIGRYELTLDDPEIEAALARHKQHMENALRELMSGKGDFEPHDTCFITTAACEVVGLADDCWELRMLRHFRDTVLPRLPRGPEDIARYYREAPAILDALRRRADARRTLLTLYWRWIVPCSILAAFGAGRLCHRAYRSMMRRLAALAARS